MSSLHTKFEPASSFCSRVIARNDRQTWQSYKPKGWAKNQLNLGHKACWGYYPLHIIIISFVIIIQLIIILKKESLTTCNIFYILPTLTRIHSSNVAKNMLKSHFSLHTRYLFFITLTEWSMNEQARCPLTLTFILSSWIIHHHINTVANVFLSLAMNKRPFRLMGDNHSNCKRYPFLTIIIDWHIKTKCSWKTFFVAIWFHYPFKQTRSDSTVDESKVQPAKAKCAVESY
jgi:hypothetical protein